MTTAKCLAFLSACGVSICGTVLTAAPLSAQLAQPAGVRQPALSAAAVARSDDADVPGGGGRRVLLVAGGTVLGAALGGGAGYAVAAVRCGRRDGCSPAEAYPYPRFGVIAGAVIGGGLAYGSTGFISSRRQVATSAAGMLAANAWSWIAAGEGRRSLGFGARLHLPAAR